MPSLVTQTVSLGMVHYTWASPWQQMQSDPWKSPFTQGGFHGGGSHTLPLGFSQRVEAAVRFYTFTQGLPWGQLPHNTSGSPEGCRRPADPPGRVLAESPPPPPPLTRTVRARGAGRGSGAGGLYTAGPAPPMAAREPACWDRAPGAGGAGGTAG